MYKLGLLLIATLPAFPIAITNIDAEWSVTRISDGTELCGGTATSNFVGTACDAIAELPGFGLDLTVIGSADTFGTGAYADTVIRAGLSSGAMIDRSLYEIHFDAQVTSAATNLVMFLGGSGSGLFQGFTASGRDVIPGTTGDADSESKVKITCTSDDLVCPEQVFTFGEAFLVTASSQAHVVGIPDTEVGATAFAFGGILDNRIFDLDHNPLPGAFAVPVPEPSSWAGIASALVFLIWMRFRKSLRSHS